jgi:WhiB family redox-sensing transcriptional regulator
VIDPLKAPERVLMPSSQLAVGFRGWMWRGACQDEDPEFFFPVSEGGGGLTQVFAAKAVCFRCTVRAACLSYALDTRQAGIWGGTTQEERRVMRRNAGVPVRLHHATFGAASPAHHQHSAPGEE